MKNKFTTLILSIYLVVCLGGGLYSNDACKLTAQGQMLTPEQVNAIEKKLESHPEDIALRTKLLGYYFARSFRNAENRNAKCRHVLWLIKNAPDSPVLGLPYGKLDKILDKKKYEEGKVLWFKHLKDKPDNMQILKYATGYFLIHDRKQAAQLLEKACKITPDNPEWHTDLGNLYMLDVIKAPSQYRKNFAVKSLQQFELAYKLSDGIKADMLLSSIAKMALAAGDLDKAKEYAGKILSVNADNWNYGNNINCGNIILGRIALKSGDVAVAIKFLQKAGDTPGSPQLNSFGPNMSLAYDLLKKGEKEAVLKYFSQCEKFWKMGQKRLKQWSAEIKSGKMPQFGGNLYY